MNVTRSDTLDLWLLGQPFQVRGEPVVVDRVRHLLDWFARPSDSGADVDAGAGAGARPTVVSVRRSAGEPVRFRVDVAGAAGRPGDGAVDVAGAAGRPGIRTTGPAGNPPAGPAGATTLVLAALNAAALAGSHCLAVHAGVVAGGGRAVAFPAASGQGKSTLTAACLRLGLDYVSDEALCLDWRDGGVLPYPRPLELSGWSRAAVGLRPGPDDALVTAARLGAGPASPPLVLEHVVLLCRHADPGCTEVSLEPLPPQRAAAALLTRSFNHWRDPDRAFELAHEVAARTLTWRLRLGDPLHAAALLADLLAR